MDAAVSTVSLLVEGIYSLSLAVMEVVFGAVVGLLYLVPSLVAIGYSVVQFVIGYFLSIVYICLDLIEFSLRSSLYCVDFVYRVLVFIFTLPLTVMDKFGVDVDKGARTTKTTDGGSLFDDALLLWKNLMNNFLYLSIIVSLFIFLYVLLKLSISKCLKKRKITFPPSQARVARNTERTNTPVHTRPPINTSTSGRVRRRVTEDKDNKDTGLTEEVSRLSEQLIEERDKHSCVVCLDNKREILLKPCKHFCLCVKCLAKLTRCPVCNQTIYSSEKIFHV